MRERYAVLLAAGAIWFAVSCAEEALPPGTAEKYVRETVAKMPAPSVTIFAGMMTDDTYVPTYRAIAADKKYLIFEDAVFVKEAGRSMPRLSLTDEGKKVFTCDRNRCTAAVCALDVEKVDPPVKVGKEWHVTYTLRSTCEGPLYTALKRLADRQFVKPSSQQSRLVLQPSPDGNYTVRIP